MDSKISTRTTDAIADHDGTALARLIHDAEITQVEVVTAVIERAQSAEPLLNAIVAADFDQALQQAKDHRVS